MNILAMAARGVARGAEEGSGMKKPDSTVVPFKREARPDEYWVCACTRRSRGRLTHIKSNHPSVLKCKRCGVTKAQHDRLDFEMKARGVRS